MKTTGTCACLWPGLPVAPACLGLASAQQDPGFNIPPLQSKERHLQWHLPKKNLGRQSISEMLRHNFLPVFRLPQNAANSLQTYISIELLPCQC